ncbi:hypothetical protein ACQCSX_04445 [Pseudarthrobacter sp. P1]|uniref:hypothetical protein n=1 Tax=Pseudarthrobacter sp. P1 TaxID=3418418 RepID=UPI003CEBFA14
MSEKRRVHNPGPHEVVFTRAGNVLPGFTSALADPEDPVTARLLVSGALILPDLPPAPAPDEPPSAPVRTRKPTKTTDAPESGA